MDEGYVGFAYIGTAILLAVAALALLLLGLSVRRQLRRPSMSNLAVAGVSTVLFLGSAYWLWYTRL